MDNRPLKMEPSESQHSDGVAAFEKPENFNNFHHNTAGQQDFNSLDNFNMTASHQRVDFNSQNQYNDMNAHIRRQSTSFPRDMASPGMNSHYHQNSMTAPHMATPRMGHRVAAQYNGESSMYSGTNFNGGSSWDQEIYQDHHRHNAAGWNSNNQTGSFVQDNRTFVDEEEGYAGDGYEDQDAYGDDGYDDQDQEDYEDEDEVQYTRPRKTARTTRRHPESSPVYLAKYQTEAEALSAEPTRRSTAAKNSMSKGRGGYPTDEAEIRGYIKRLYEAFHNVDDIVDKPCKNGNMAQAAQKINDGFYPAKAVERACWDLFAKCRDAQMGVRLIPSFHNSKLETENEHANFDARFNCMLDGVNRSKAICKMVLDSSFSCRLAQAPDHQMKLKLNNKKINSERDKQNEAGRKVLKKGYSAKDIDVLDPIIKKEQDDEDDGHSPSKMIDDLNLRTPGSARARNLAYGSGQRNSSSKRKARVSSIDADDVEFIEDRDYRIPASGTSAGSSARKRRLTVATPTRHSRNTSVRPVAPGMILRSQPERRLSGASSEFNFTPRSQPERLYSATPQRQMPSSSVYDHGAASHSPIVSPHGHGFNDVPHYQQMASPSHHGYGIAAHRSQMASPNNNGYGSAAHHSQIVPSNGPRFVPASRHEHTVSPNDQSFSAASTHEQMVGFVPTHHRRTSTPNNPHNSPAYHPKMPSSNGDEVTKVKVEPVVSYKRILCGLLEVPPQFGDRFTLTQLRQYVRAYNTHYENTSWSNDNYPGWVGKKYVMTGPNNETCHLAELMPEFQDLAEARGDLLTNEGNPPKMVTPSDFPIMQEALGLVENDCGLHDPVKNI